MDEVNDFESTPQVACSLSPIETAILICIVAYIIIKGVKKFIPHKFSSSQPRDPVVDGASQDKNGSRGPVSDNTFQSVENSTTPSTCPLRSGDTVAGSLISTSDSTVAESESIEVGDVVEMNGSSSTDEYYVVLSRDHNGDVAITNSTFKVKYDCKPGQLKLVEQAQNNHVTIEEFRDYRCTRYMRVASVKNPLKLKIFIEGDLITVTNDFHNGMVVGIEFGEEDSYYFPALLLEEVEEDDY